MNDTNTSNAQLLEDVQRRKLLYDTAREAERCLSSGDLAEVKLDGVYDQWGWFIRRRRHVQGWELGQVGDLNVWLLEGGGNPFPQFATRVNGFGFMPTLRIRYFSASLGGPEFLFPDNLVHTLQMLLNEHIKIAKTESR